MPTSTSTIEATQYVVLRSFEASGIVRERGEVLDTSSWLPRRALVLEERRYLVELPHGLSPIGCACGRRWADEEPLSYHSCDAAAPKAAPTRTRQPRAPKAAAGRTTRRTPRGRTPKKEH